MQVDHAGGEGSVFRGRRWRVLEAARAAWRIVEGPVLDIALATLHDGASRRVPAGDVGCGIGLREVEIGLGHPQLGPDTVEADFAVGPLEREGMTDGHLAAVFMPLVHAPEMGVPQIETEFVHEPRHERQLLRRPDWSADADRIVGSRLPPGRDVFERLGEVEILERVVEDDLKPGP